ncbi:hypothetical protein SEVIR_3G154500v4 [Setaria viridis]|uniref:DUF1639 domain-containing protein n=1 Tax=Setaria viridis TaxID=4556 RepID=A0A4U6VBU1_SETVI|nr:translation initiation factor IF-2-like [Setaria viridis]TKW25955.1 hypothetical protein SEVIR_3G154500v2 [Setaria viridis]
MRGSAEAVAVARDVASSSPSKPAPALDMMRFQRPSSDCLPLPNGIAAAGSGSGSRKPPAAPAPRSSKDDASPAVATDSSRLAAFLASTSLEPKPRARAPQPPAQAAPSSLVATAAATRSPARDHGNNQHHLSDFSDPASPSAAVAGGGAEVLLQWGQNKRLRGRRDGASGSGASPLRGQQSAKIQRRSPVPADKLLMPPPSGPSYTRGSNLRSASPLPSRSGAGIGTSDAHHGRGALPHHHRSAEEQRAGGKPSAAAAAGKQQRQAADKAHKAGLGPVMGLGVPDPKQQQQQGGSGSQQQQQAGGAGASSSAKPAPKLELPRIYTTLSRKEKEEDFMAMKGTKLPQRPKRRPKNVEKAVNFICPGTWLTDVTRSRYEVREKKCPKKQQKHRGLKGMESMDSDSD